MIAFLKVNLAQKSGDSIVLEVEGVGYELGMATGSIAKLSDIGDTVLLYTYLHVREDALQLYGFLTLDEKNIFLRLISVSGIGAKIALGALSIFSPQELVSHITGSNVDAISSIPGIGKKTASRIVLELKGSLDKALIKASTTQEKSNSEAFQEAYEVLLSMGFTPRETELALLGATKGVTTNVLLQYALKRLGKPDRHE
jgi:Holliday junction DNA helicase RuvA